MKIYSRSYRVRKAYWTAFVVMLSYVRLHLVSKIMGKKYKEKRMVALHLKNAYRIKNAILELQGLFIKVGQLLSILTNFLPEQFQGPLEGLQDKIPARPYAEIQQRIEKEFGKKPLDLFAHFEEVPIAAASIGQAHRATLHEGTEVVVKVQHANIEQTAQIDLEIIEKLTNLVSRFMDIKGMEYAYTQVRKMIEEELDFKKEAVAMEIIRSNLKDEPGLLIPKTHPEFCTQRVLCTTFYEGVKISNLPQLEAWGLDKTDLAKRLVHAYCQMVFKDGFYHADPHPGNILVQESGAMVLLDFGAVAALKPEMRTGFLQLLEGAVKNDTEKIINSLMALGFIADEKAAIKVAEKVIDALRNFLENEVQFDGLNLKDIQINPFESSLFSLITDIGLQGIADVVQVPKDYVLLNRMVSLLLGICSTLDSQMNPIDVVQPYFREFMLGERGDVVNFVKDLLQRTVTNLLAMPGDIQKVLKKLRRGELEIKIEGQVEKTNIMYALGQQLIYTFLMIAIGGFAYLFYQEGAVKILYYLGGLQLLFLLLFIGAMRKARKYFRRLE